MRKIYKDKHSQLRMKNTLKGKSFKGEIKELKMNEKDIKIGQMIRLTKSYNVSKRQEGSMFRVIEKTNEDYIKVKEEITGSIAYLYYNKDLWDFVNRQEQAKALLEHIKDLKKQIVSLKKEHTNLIKFETDEDETADKLNSILESKGDVSKIAKILKELKTSDYL